MSSMLRGPRWALIILCALLCSCADNPTTDNNSNLPITEAQDPARMLRNGDAAGARHLLLKLSTRTCEQELLLSEAALQLQDVDGALAAALRARGMATNDAGSAHRADLASGEAFLAAGRAEESLTAFSAARKSAPSMQDRDRAIVCCARAELARGGVEAARRLRNEILRSDIRELADLDRRLAQIEKPVPPKVASAPLTTTETTGRATLARRPQGKGIAPPPMQSRASWNAKPIKLRNEPDPLGKVERITVHHTADPNGLPGSSLLENIARVRAYQSAHQDGEKWADIGYHFVIDRQGRIFEGRELCWQGAHAGNDAANYRNVGVALIGDFERMKPTDAQRTALQTLLGWLMKEYSLPWSVVKGHNDVKRSHMAKGTTCPGKHLQALLKQLSAKS